MCLITIVVCFKCHEFQDIMKTQEIIKRIKSVKEFLCDLQALSAINGYRSKSV